MRILQVTPYFGEHYGGTERYCYNLSKALVELGHDTHVFAACLNSSTPREEEIAGVKVHRFPTITTIWNINPLPIMFHRLLNADFDVIHIHSYLYFTANQAALSKIFRTYLQKETTLLLHLHGGLGIPPYLDHQPIKKVVKRIYDKTIGKLMMLSADHVLSACRSDAEEAQTRFNIPDDKITIIYNAIEPSMFTEYYERKLQANGRYILFVGDLERWKGLSTLIKGIHVLKERGDIFSLKLAGMGSLEPYLRKIADGVDVHFLGRVPHTEIPSLMNSAFAFVLPSLWEGLPTVGLEAMASGVPVIGTDIGGIPEIIADKQTGLLIPVNDAEAIADAIQSLYDEQLRENIMKNANELVKQKFTIEKIARDTVKLYEKMTS